MSTNKKKLIKLFATSLNISETIVNDNLKYNEIEEWDSIGHMSLMSAIEDEFKISLETDDIIDFSSFKKGTEILEKYKKLIFNE